MAPIFEEIIKLGMPINSYYAASGADQQKRKQVLIPECRRVLDELKKKVPALKLAKGDDFQMTWIAFHVFGEFVQSQFKDEADLKAALDALMAFLQIDNGEQYGPYQTLIKLYLALGDTDNAYQVATNISAAFDDEWLIELLASAAYTSWKKRQ